MATPYRLSLGDLLDHFSSSAISRALGNAGLPGDGSKIERLERLRRHARAAGALPAQVVALFDAAEIRRVGLQFGVRHPHKAGMVGELVALLTDLGTPLRAVPRTMPALRDLIRSLAHSRRTIRSEADAEHFVASAIADHFDGVRTQCIVPGHLGHRIDVDIQGQLGVEVKLATTIANSSSEAYRLLGQAYYYDRRRYGGRLLVVVVGPVELGTHAVIAELSDLLASLGVAYEYLPID